MPTLSEILLPSARAAEAALLAVGAARDTRLDLETEVDGVRIARRFGVLRNPLVDGPAVTDARLLDKFRDLLTLPENADQRAKAQELTYCPVNKSTLVQLSDGLLSKKIHLPLTFRPMMLDLATKIMDLERAFPFDVFYARSVQVVPQGRTGAAPAGPAGAGTTLNAGRLFSIPVSGSSDVTRMEPLDDQELDLRVGLLLEVDGLIG